MGKERGERKSGRWVWNPRVRGRKIAAMDIWEIKD